MGPCVLRPAMMSFSTHEARKIINCNPQKSSREIAGESPTKNMASGIKAGKKPATEKQTVPNVNKQKE
jgi:hypothetical protein